MDVLMPQLGETVAEGTVSAWHKQEGDRVEANEILLDVETDKVSMEIPAPGAGTLAKILVQPGETVDVGTVLGVITAAGESAAADETQASTAPASDGGASAPSEWETRAPATEAAAAAGAPTAPETRAASAPREQSRRLSPAVRRLAAEHDVDLDDVEGSGRNGRITRRDMIRFLERREAQPAPAAAARAEAAPPAAKPAAPSPAPARPGTRVPFNRIRKLTAEHMVRSKATSPHVLQAVEADFSGIARVRDAMRESFKAQHGFALTYLPFIAHAACLALREFPHVNASVEDDALVLHEHVNLGIAIDLGSAEGLVAPVIQSAEGKSVLELAGAIHDLAARARANRLKPDDLAGGTYTLSNSGVFGTLITAPIINQPQVAILSTDGVRKKPVVIERPHGDSIAIRPVGILAQSFDHRAIDGAYSAAFLDRLRKLIEQTDWFREV